MSAPEETEAAEAAEAEAVEAAGAAGAAEVEAAYDEGSEDAEDAEDAEGSEAAEVEGDEAAEAEVAYDEGSEDAENSEDSEDCEDSEDSEDSEGAGDGPNLFDAIKEEVAELRDRYARLQAEWDNYRKRTEAARAEERLRAAEGLVTDLLPVLDDLERALAHARDAAASADGGAASDADDAGDAGSGDASAGAAGADATGLIEGVEAIQGKLLSILGKHEVAQIEALGQPFDAQCHQAVSVREDDTVDEETVVEVLQQGYVMGERVIRPAMVVTSTK